MTKDTRYRTQDAKICARLTKEGYPAVESISAKADAPNPMTHVFNIDAKKVREEECRECKRIVCVCPKVRTKAKK